MYEVQFVATSSADWAQAVELIDTTTNLPLDVPDEAVFELTIGDRCCSCGGFDASSDDGEITMPTPSTIQWNFTRTDLNRYWPRNTYPVGLTMTTNGGTVQLLVGTLSIIDGVVR